MLHQYKTILEAGEFEISEKKSRFIAYLQPVKTEEEAKSFINSIKKMHRQANHNVFAYCIGERNEIERYSDDGEPQGTAGLPMLHVLQAEELKNVVVVVTRYFGGTLLGTGGLVRAYTRATKEGLDFVGIASLQLYAQYEISMDYTAFGKIQYEMLQENYVLQNIAYTDVVTCTALCEIEREEKFIKHLTEWFLGQPIYNKLEDTYGMLEKGEVVFVSV